jgi:hypothetical protein
MVSYLVDIAKIDYFDMLYFLTSVDVECSVFSGKIKREYIMGFTLIDEVMIIEIKFETETRMAEVMYMLGLQHLRIRQIRKYS